MCVTPPIALVYLLYNLLGVLVLTVIPWIKDTPVMSAAWLGYKTDSNRGRALGCIASVFIMMRGEVFAAKICFGESEAVSEEAIAADGVIEDVEREVLENERVIE